MLKLMEQVVESENLRKAYRRILMNRGAPGVDGMEVESFAGYLREEWPRIAMDLLEDRYRPQPVRGVEIPKPGGGMRQLGIPTVLDRFIQQAMHQVMSPLLDPHFSEHSYGFRKGRSAHQAILKAQKHIQEGRTSVVDHDLEKFFDRVQHDVLMARVARRIEDKGRGMSLKRIITEGLTPLLRGWMNYFRLSEGRGPLETLDGWIRRKLRVVLWRQWGRRVALYRNLVHLGVQSERAWKCVGNGRGPWWNAGAAHMNSALPKAYFDGLGLLSLVDHWIKHRQSSQTAGCGTACPVV